MTKKVLIITYYWPPSGGGGVQRWLKFAKYLPDNNWQPIIFTPENPDFDLKDTTLERDVHPDTQVIRFPIWEPFQVYKSLFQKKSDGKLKQGIVIEKSKMSLMDKMVIWVRANLFFPDPRRFWIKPSIDFLKVYIEDNDITTVVTTGPPHSMHLIGLGLKMKLDIKWIADFRDPWSEWDILDKLNTSKFVKKMHRRFESKVLKHADLIVTVSNRLADSFRNKGNHRVAVVTNGVDDADFEMLDEQTLPTKFRISHMGLLNEIRDPSTLWKVLEELCEEKVGFQEDLEIVLAGMVSQSIQNRLNNSKALASRFRHLDYISHKEVFKQYGESAVLLLLLNQTDNAKWILPGKFFEYLLANRPILTLGDKESDVADILEETSAGTVIDFEDKIMIKEMLSSAYIDFKNKKLTREMKNTDAYLRRNLSTKMAGLLDEI